METKICILCNQEKEISKFRPHRRYCRDCGNLKNREWKKLNQEHIKEYSKKYFQEHKKEIANKRREYMYEYRQTDKYKKHKKEYAQKNQSKVNEQQKIRYKENKMCNLKHNVRVEIARGFKTKGMIKNKHTEEMLGCSLNYIYDYLLQTYKNNYGVEWDGIEKVHIDHKIPLATAKTKEEVIKLCHYTNLQLLKAKDNLKKWCYNG